jgi:WD40 repeat protein
MNIHKYLSVTLLLAFNAIHGQNYSMKKLDLNEVLPIITPNQKLVKISPDGKLLVTKGNTGINIWDYKTEKVLKYLPFENTTDQIQFSSDGKYMASVEAEQLSPKFISSVIIWETSNWNKLINLGQVSKNNLDNFCFDVDNSQIYTIENGAMMDGSCTLKCYNLIDGKLVNSITLPEWSRFKNIKALDKNHLLVSRIGLVNIVNISAKKTLSSTEIITFGGSLRSDSLLSFHIKRPKFYQKLDIKTWEIKSFKNIPPSIFSATSTNGLFYAQMVKIEKFEGLKVWDLANQKEIYSRELSSVAFSSLSISDDSKYVFLGQNDKTYYMAELGDTPTLKEVTGKSIEKTREKYNDMVLADNQKKIVISNANGILVYDLQNESITKSIEPKSISNIEYSSKNNSIFFFSENTNIGQINLSDFTQKKEVSYSFLNNAIASNSNLLAVGNKVGNKTTLYNINDLSVKNIVGDGGGLGGISLINFSNDDLIFATNQYGDLTIWESATGKKVKHFPNFHKFYINAMTFSKDNKSIISSGGGDYKIRVTNLDNINNIKFLEGHTKSISNLCVSHDGKYLYSSSDDNTVKVWDLVQNKLIKTIFESNYKIVKLIVSTDDKSLYILDENSLSVISITN